MSEQHSAEKVVTVPVDLRADGVLWAINRVLFHPRGFALAVDTTTGDLTLWGNGHEPWRYGESIGEDEHFEAFERLLDRATTYAIPPTGGES